MCGKRRQFAGTLFALLIALRLMPVGSGVAYGQVGASLGGSVTDDSGGILPGATVSVTNTLNGTTHVLVTGTAGEYRAIGLSPAPYTVKAELAGFSPQTRTITLTVGASATLDFKLGLAGIAESVNVVSEAPLVETARAAPTSAVLADQISALPVLDRNFLVLAQTLPGSAPLTAGSTTFATTKFGGPADQRNGYTTVIDGGSIDDATWGSPVVNVSQDAVQEFKVFRNQFDAQYGAALNAVVTVATKSGGNLFSGSGYYFGRDDSLDSRNVFATTKPPFNQTRAGGSFGGPIVQNRTHFFGAFEDLVVNNSSIVSLPTSNPFASLENGIYPIPSREKLADFKIDHQAPGHHALTFRYAYDNNTIASAHVPVHDVQGLSLGTGNTDSKIIAHSVLGQDNWVVSDRAVNSVRLHYFRDYLATLPDSTTMSVSRPSFSWGQSTIAPQIYDRWNFSVNETFYWNLASHSFKIGADLGRDDLPFEAHFFEKGAFVFGTDAPFDPNNPKTWPISFQMALPGFFDYRSTQFGPYAQDDWQLTSRLHMNVGVRYDLDTHLRINDFYTDLLSQPHYSVLGSFRGATDGGTYLNTLQPRLGLTYDARGNGSVVIRGGWGRYVARNRPWFDTRAENQTLSSSVFITDPAALQHFPDINAVLGGKSLGDFAATTSQNIGTLIPGDFKLPSGYNTTTGLEWQLNRVTSVDIDYINQLGRNQIGIIDENQPSAGPISAANPRPVSQFAQVAVLRNYVTSRYNALEVQLRTRVRGANSLQVSYTYSRQHLEGVDFFSTFRNFGPGRVPQDVGEHPLDTPNNLSVSGSTRLPWDIQLSAIVKWLSAPPFTVNSGLDLNGDGLRDDTPLGLPPWIGRGDVTGQLAILNGFRQSLGLQPVAATLLDLEQWRYFTVDMRATKAFPLSNRQRLEAFLETFNLTNHVNLMGYNGNINTNSFLVPSSARPARQIQWGARYSF